QCGSRKWDVDGHELVDYWSGHGAMLLGHSHPDVVAAVQAQVAKSTHAGGGHDLEVGGGGWGKRLHPAAGRGRVTRSGAEATPVPVGRAGMFPGRPKFLKFAGHFHGWHDAVWVGSDPPYDNLAVPGVPEGVAANTVVIAPNDLDLLERTLRDDAQIG